MERLGIDSIKLGRRRRRRRRQGRALRR